MNTNNIGGGEILQYINNGSKEASRLDENLIRMFKMLPFVKVLIYILIIVLFVYVILKMFNVGSPFSKRGTKSEIKQVMYIKKRDAKILRANKFMAWATKIIGRTPLSLDKTYREYWQYNITRAGIKIPGGSRYMKAVEFHSLIQIASLLSIAVAFLIMLFINTILGWVLIFTTVIITNSCPMLIVRQTVKDRDQEISDNFSELYLMLHYVIIENTTTPLSGIMKSYAKTTASYEMIRFIDVCIHYIDTYGEYEATRYIAKDYREIPEVGKLMRLIRQANEGGEIRAELLGFREELINAKEYALKRRRDKLVGKARASFNILLIVLVQAILSAMSIYMSDLGLAKGLLG